MASDHDKARTHDATVLMTSADARDMIAASRALNISITRLEQICHKLVRSTEDLTKELSKGRRHGKKDRRNGHD